MVLKMIVAVYLGLAFVSPAYAQIQIYMKGSLTDYNLNSIDVAGFEQHVINDKEIKWFGITDANLKRGVKEMMGQEPDHAFLKGPTPNVGDGADLFKVLQEKQTSLKYSAVGGEVIDVSSKPVIVAHQIYKNDFKNKTLKYTATMSQSVTNTFTSTWKNEATLGAEVKVSVKMVMVESEVTVSQSTMWGHDESDSNTTTLTVGSGLELELKPGESARVSLVATQGELTCRVFFNVRIYGNVIVNYYYPYKGHHYYAIETEGVLENARIDWLKSSSADYRAGFFAGATLRSGSE